MQLKVYVYVYILKLFLNIDKDAKSIYSDLDLENLFDQGYVTEFSVPKFYFNDGFLYVQVEMYLYGIVCKHKYFIYIY